jgi:small conductance mechanosensitive channel
VEIMGVDAFRDWSLVMKLRIKTVPLKQWDVGREFRKRLKKALDHHGVEIPFPERIVTVRETPTDTGKVAG